MKTFRNNDSCWQNVHLVAGSGVGRQASGVRRKLFNLSSLEIEAFYKPLGYEHEPFSWKSEKATAPWMIFVLKKS